LAGPRREIDRGRGVVFLARRGPDHDIQRAVPDGGAGAGWHRQRIVGCIERHRVARDRIGQRRADLGGAGVLIHLVLHDEACQRNLARLDAGAQAGGQA